MYNAPTKSVGANVVLMTTCDLRDTKYEIRSYSPNAHLRIAKSKSMQNAMVRVCDCIRFAGRQSCTVFRLHIQSVAPQAIAINTPKVSYLYTHSLVHPHSLILIFHFIFTMRSIQNSVALFIGLIATTSSKQLTSRQSDGQYVDVIYGSNGTVTLTGNSTDSGLVLLDYGANVEGFPTFEVVSVTGDISGFKIRYSETKSVLETNPDVC